MLNGVKFVNYEKCYPSRLKRFFQSDLNYRTYDGFIPNMKRAVVGNLPPELIKFFPKENRKYCIKEFQNALSDIARFERAQTHSVILSDLRSVSSEELKTLENEMSNLFNKRIERISQNGQITGKFKFAGHGAFGNVFRFSLFDENGCNLMHDKALKLYHNPYKTYGGLENVHNSYAESNFWTYLKHAAGHNLDRTQFTRHYISDLHSGYAMTEFIDYSIHNTSTLLDMQNIFRLKSLDIVNNIPLLGKIFDVGGYRKQNNFIDDKVVLRYFKKLYYRSNKELPNYIANLEKLINNPKTPHREKIQRALELFKEHQNI